LNRAEAIPLPRENVRDAMLGARAFLGPRPIPARPRWSENEAEELEEKFGKPLAALLLPRKPPSPLLNVPAALQKLEAALIGWLLPPAAGWFLDPLDLEAVAAVALVGAGARKELAAAVVTRRYGSVLLPPPPHHSSLARTTRA